MTTMALIVSMTRSGFWPEKVIATAWGFDNVIRLRMECLVRPIDGERTSETPQALAERDGMEGDDVRCALRLIGGRTRDEWTGMVRVSRHIVVHGLEETDRRMRIAREAFGMSPDWRRPAMQPIDTAALAMTAMGLDRPPSLEDATAALVGSRMSGIDGIVALVNAPALAKLRRAA